MKSRQDTNARVAARAEGRPKASAERIVVQEIPDVKLRPRHVPEVAASVELARVAGGDPDPLRALDRITKHARTFLLLRGAR